MHSHLFEMILLLTQFIQERRHSTLKTSQFFQSRIVFQLFHLCSLCVPKACELIVRIITFFRFLSIQQLLEAHLIHHIRFLQRHRQSRQEVRHQEGMRLTTGCKAHGQVLERVGVDKRSIANAVERLHVGLLAPTLNPLSSSNA